MMKPACSILIPTYNNPAYLSPCISSIASTGVLRGLCELVVINNGSQPIENEVKDWPNTRVLSPGKNLGWERGLQYGLDNTDSEYVCFQNDDTHIPRATQTFYQQLLWPFQNKNVAAVGPATTIAAGWHSIFMRNPIRSLIEVPYLIFFTVMMRRDYLLEAGGIDVMAPGGDDLDLSIRFRSMKKKLLINPDAFIIHHAFKTGERVRGTSDTPGGWNSKEMTDRTNQWLIQKHGFKAYMQTIRGFDYQSQPSIDLEGEEIAKLVRGPIVIELGCGARKTVPEALGIDLVGKGDHCINIDGESVADIVSDITKPLPMEDNSVDTIIARHILEHCIDAAQTLKNWNRVLVPGGRLIIAVPNQELRNTIPLNPEHVCAYTPFSLQHLVELCGFKETHVRDPKNGISFIAVFEKTLHTADVREREFAGLTNGKEHA